MALCAIPPALAVWRYWPLHIAPAEAIWYQYRSVGIYLVDLFILVAVIAWLLSLWAAGPRSLWERARERAAGAPAARGLSSSPLPGPLPEGARTGRARPHFGSLPLTLGLALLAVTSLERVWTASDP